MLADLVHERVEALARDPLVRLSPLTLLLIGVGAAVVLMAATAAVAILLGR